MKEPEEIDDSEDFYQELEEQQLATLKKHIRSRKGSRNSRNNSATEALYKQALLDSIFGRFQQASKKLKHMITLSPDSPEPYHLLGNMHEQNGQLDKAVEYLFMSTYLSPPNLEKWLKVGDLSFQLKMYNQAAYCYGRALKIASCDPKIMIRRAEAFELAGQSKKAVATYKRLLTISQSPEYVKKYAKLRYKRGQYLICREILQGIDNYITDMNIVYMICETYLQEHSYEEAAKILEHHLEVRSESMQEQEMLPSEFIVILFICSVILNRQCYGFSASTLLEEIKSCYDQDYTELYADAISHVSKHSQQHAFELTSFLIKYPQHQSVTNYIMVIDYLCKKKDRSCLSILQNALKKHPYAPQLLAQRDYVHKCFGIGVTLKQAEEIFYSDEDQLQSFAEHIPQAKKNNLQHADNQVMERIIQNVEESLALLIDQINKGSAPGTKQQQTIMDGLDLFISLTPGSREEDAEEREGLYIKKIAKKRNNQGENRVNLMNEHMTTVMKYFQNLVVYLQCLLSNKQWRKLIQIGEKVSKVHMFKNHSKNTDFIELKIAIYEMCTLSCLAVNKFNTAIFFLRFLVTKHPQDSLYALSMHLLMRICSKKTFLSSALGKRLNNTGGQHLAKLLAVQYMETGCFELAISALLRSSNNKQSLGPTSQLCLAACLIQIASSRNTFNKLDFTNRSAICLASYENVVENKWEGLFNRGRWYAQVKVNHKAIECFQKIVKSSEASIAIKQRAAYCLICIYRDCDQYEKADELSLQFFPIPQQPQPQNNDDVIVQ